MRVTRKYAMAATLLLLAMNPLVTNAQKSSNQPAPVVTKYQFYDVGTLGGSSSYIFNFDAYGGVFTPSPLNSLGQVAGSSLVVMQPN